MNDQQSVPQGHFSRNKIFYIVIGLFVLASLAIYVAKDLEINRMNKAHVQEITEVKDSLAQEKVNLINQTREIIKANNQQQLELMLSTFVWAVRAEMIRGNLDQVDQYFRQLVKAENIKEIQLVDPQGTIILATNKKLEEKPFEEYNSDEFLSQDNVLTVFAPDNTIRISSPVMSFNSRLGTVFMIYQPTDKFANNPPKAAN